MKDTKENASQFALLGLLHDRPMSGYAIKKSFDEGVNYFWNVSYGQIYPELRRLVARGHASVREEQGSRGPARKVYRITARGRKALRDWLAKPPAMRPARSEVALKLCFGAIGRLEDQISHLETFADQQERQLQTLRRIEEAAEAGAPDREEMFSLLTLRMGIALSDAMVQWARDSIRTLENSGELSAAGGAAPTAGRATSSHGTRQRGKQGGKGGPA